MKWKVGAALFKGLSAVHAAVDPHFSRETEAALLPLSQVTTK